MCKDKIQLNRRALLGAGSAVAAILSMIPILVWQPAAAATKADKAALDYQDSPKDGKTCATCWAYVDMPGTASGSCKAVEGTVNRNGWCKAYSPKQMR